MFYSTIKILPHDIKDSLTLLIFYLQASDLLFCYRWLLLELKREFAFDDALRMLEVLWASLPADCPKDELKMYQGATSFKPKLAAPQSSIPLGVTRHSAYTRLCAMRRRDARRLSTNKSLDERQLGQHTVSYYFPIVCVILLIVNVKETLYKL